MNSEFTHLLKCAHCIGNNRNIYYMKCKIIKTTKNNKLKIMVFGERDWQGKDHIKKIRYVDQNRVVSAKGLLIEQKALELETARN